MAEAIHQVEDWRLDYSVNILDNIDSGSYASKLIQFDPFYKTITKNDFNLFKDQYKINNDFSLSEQKEAKQVFEGLFKSSLAIPSFNAKGEFKVIPVHQLEIDNWEEFNANGTQAINSNTIDNQHILKYSFSLTKLEDVKSQVNVKYKKNYA